MASTQLQPLLAQLALSVPPQRLVDAPEEERLPVLRLLEGRYAEILSDDEALRAAGAALAGGGGGGALAAMVGLVAAAKYPSAFRMHLTAIALLQLFVQANYTGPAVEYDAAHELLGVADAGAWRAEAVRCLDVAGQPAYGLMERPECLVLALLLFERVANAPAHVSVVQGRGDPEAAAEWYAQWLANDPVAASLRWWMARAFQVHNSVLPEPAAVLSAVLTVLLGVAASALAPAAPGLQRAVQVAYLLESARAAIHNQTEHLAVPLLVRAREVARFEFVLTGAKAKRTKFQAFHTAALVVLAKSETPTDGGDSDDGAGGAAGPERFSLDSDLLLERPHYELLEDVELEGAAPGAKRLRLDPDPDPADSATDPERLVPIAARAEDIAPALKKLDPNHQPRLADWDNVQLLLRLTTLRQTLPLGSTLVDEELLALVGRVLYADGAANWLVFARALWERSVLETSKARTIERGILQMTSLVEEMGIKIKARVIPAAAGAADAAGAAAAAATRLRFIHQLPLQPQWRLDAQLAEKYMSLGVLRSAVEIYTRLDMASEAALCYAAVGEEHEAERVLTARLQAHPEDARALSILGDVRQDPQLWERAWLVGRYYRAQALLARYYYRPPPASGLTPSVELAIKHMHICLTANPLNYENWFFYGCCGLETQQFALAAEAFTRCVSIDDTNSHAWSNLATALLRTDKTRPAFNALKKALRSQDDAKSSWRIYENYLIVAAKLHEWNDVLIAVRQLVEARRDAAGERLVDVPVVEKLVEILVASEYPRGDARLTHFQLSCIDLVCRVLPGVITTLARCWRVVARVELWRRRPWAALECHERAFRAAAHRADLETDEAVWRDAVEACADLVAAYESLGELPGKHDAADVVCLDWRYKARSAVRSLMSKGKAVWDGTEGWDRLEEMKAELSNR